jgi:uncharacterized membrane protein YsdA (DUF1294 family)
MQWILLVYAATSLVTLAAYGLDKRAAIRGRRRIPESTLHLLELIGGFPGGFAGQQLFRHKRAKVRYLVVFWAIVAIHAAAWAAWAWLRWCQSLNSE